MAEYIERAAAAGFFEKSKQTMWHKDDVAATISNNAIPAADVVERMNWIDAKTNPPTEQGKYLCAMGRFCIDICSYAFNLEKVDECDFYRQRRSGWYQYDSEYGHFERDDVTHYMPLPDLPKEEEK